MREDMTKVVTKARETLRCIRRPGRNPRDVEALPMRESMRADRYRSRPHLRNAAPLERWLRTQVGRPWQAVYAELSGRADLRTAFGVGVRSYVADHVLMNVYMDNGVLKALHKWGGVTEIGDDLYVDPISGLLKAGKSGTMRARLREQRRQEQVAANTLNRVIVSTERQLHKLEGQWYWIDLAPIVPPKQYRPAPYTRSDGTEVVFALQIDRSTECVDVLNHYVYHDVPKSSYTGSELLKQYGTKTHYGVRKYQASSADIRRYVSQ